MATPRKKPEDKKKVGRDTKYRKEFNARAYRYALLGMTDEEMAGLFEVAPATFSRWKATHPEFREAILRGGPEADARVAQSTYRRACGYRHKSTKFFMHKGEVIAQPYTEVYPPDTQAATLWLSNRARGKWKQRQDVELTTPAGTLVVMSALTREPLPEPGKKPAVDDG
jgi:hypothetical protein